MRTILASTLLVLFAMQALSQEPGSPQDAPDDWLLAFVDVETTGLVPGFHEMIDIGIVMTDLEGAEIAEFFTRIQPEQPQRTDAGARAVNAFNADRWRQLGALDPAAAVEKVIAFHNDNAAQRKVLMVAFNSQFDSAFLDHLFRSADHNWRELYHYFVLDVPSMAWSLGLRDLTGSALAKELGVADEPHVADQHTGITGARLNARLYRALLNRQNIREEPN